MSHLGSFSFIIGIEEKGNHIMKIFMPSKKILKFALILLPFMLLGIGLVILSVILENEVLLNSISVLILLMILIYTLGSRIIRKDNIILTLDAITYGLKHKNTSPLNLLFLQFDKLSISFVDIMNSTYDDTTKTLSIQTKQGIQTIDLKYFSDKVILKIINHINERIYHG